jgi:hypothetical protein
MICPVLIVCLFLGCASSSSLGKVPPSVHVKYTKTEKTAYRTTAEWIHDFRLNPGERDAVIDALENNPQVWCGIVHEISILNSTAREGIKYALSGEELATDHRYVIKAEMFDDAADQELYLYFFTNDVRTASSSRIGGLFAGTNIGPVKGVWHDGGVSFSLGLYINID